MFDQIVFAQVVGVVAMAFVVAVFQVNRRGLMIVLQTCGALFFALHYVLLGAPTGAAMNLFTATRNGVYAAADKKYRTRIIPVLFVVLAAALAIFTWQGLRSLLPMISAIIWTVLIWQKSTHTIRFWAVAGSIPWLMYAVLAQSYAGVATELFVLTSNAIGIYRFDIIARKRAAK